MAFVIVENVNTYVENANGYKADSVKVELNESTFVVRAYPVDTAGTQIAGSADLVTKTCANLTDGIAYYTKIVQQVEQGDVIRNI